MARGALAKLEDDVDDQRLKVANAENGVLVYTKYLLVEPLRKLYEETAELKKRLVVNQHVFNLLLATEHRSELPEFGAKHSLARDEGAGCARSTAAGVKGEGRAVVLCQRHARRDRRHRTTNWRSGVRHWLHCVPATSTRYCRHDRAKTQDAGNVGRSLLPSPQWPYGMVRGCPIGRMGGNGQGWQGAPFVPIQIGIRKRIG